MARLRPGMWVLALMAMPVVVPRVKAQLTMDFDSDEACVSAAAGAQDAEAWEVVAAMRNGWWGCAEHLAVASSAADIHNVIALESRTLTSKLGALRSALESARPPTQRLSPAFQWAQSPSAVFLNVKFSHKIDAPATLDVAVDSVELTEHGLVLRASKERKAFALDLQLRGPIDPDASSWSLASVGRAVFTLQKKGGDCKWPGLLAKGAAKPPQMHLWWDRQEEFREALQGLPKEAMAAVDASAPGGGGEGKGAEDDDATDDEEKSRAEEDQEEEALAAAEAAAKAKRKARKAAGKTAKKPKAGKKAEKGGGKTSKDSGGGGGAEEEEKEDGGEEDGGGELAGVLRTLEAETKAALAEVSLDAKAKRKAIDKECKAKKAVVAAELAAETKRIEAEGTAKRVQFIPDGADEGVEGDEAAAEEVAEEAGGEGDEDVAVWKAAAAALRLGVPGAPPPMVRTLEKPGDLAAKAASHAPSVQIPQGGKGQVEVTLPHGMAPGHWIDLLWLEDSQSGDIIAAKGFPQPPPPSESGGKGQVDDAASSQAPPPPALRAVAVPPGTSAVTAFASCNLHGVWASDPTRVQGPAAALAGEL